MNVIPLIKLFDDDDDENRLDPKPLPCARCYSIGSRHWRLELDLLLTVDLAQSILMFC